MRNKNIIAIILARGGSKGIPKKNVMSFCGKPLIAWTISQALASRHVNSVYVSSDDKEILNVAARFGAHGIDRPRRLATDTASSDAALAHALETVERKSGKKTDLIVFLQATSPLRAAHDLDNAVETLIAQKADSLFSASLLDDYCIWRKSGRKLGSLTYDYKKRGRRQDRKPLYLENGSIYVFKPSVLNKFNNRLGGRIAISIMEYWKSYEIDRVEDIEICEYFMKKNILKRR